MPRQFRVSGHWSSVSAESHGKEEAGTWLQVQGNLPCSLPARRAATFPEGTWASPRSAGAEAGQDKGWMALELRGGHIQPHLSSPAGTVLTITPAEGLCVMPRALKSIKVGEKKG